MTLFVLFCIGILGSLGGVSLIIYIYGSKKFDKYSALKYTQKDSMGYYSSG
jgi:hypothetical protein